MDLAWCLDVLKFHMLRELPWLAPAVAKDLANLANLVKLAEFAKLAKSERNPCEKLAKLTKSDLN